MSSAWRALYDALAARLPEFAGRARPVLCGLGACVDAYLRLEELAAALPEDPRTPAGALRALLLARAQRGIGGEVRIEWPGGPDFLDAHLPRRPGLGGTGAQAAQTLALLGAPALLALAPRDREQLDLIHPTVRIAGPNGFAPVGEARAAGARGLPHYIVEFTAGVAAGGVVPPRSSRVIVRFDDDPLPPDPWFDRASVAQAAAAGGAILSGLNALPAGALPGVLARVRRLALAWRAAGLAWLHLELGDFARAGDLDGVLAGLAGIATSLGLSHSELVKLEPQAGSIAERAARLAARCGCARIAVHADRFALALTAGDPERELDALMTGSLLAATRARAGRIAVPQGCPPGAQFADPPAPPLGRHGAWRLACCATPYLPRPAATIGLGDTFLAGTLLIHSQAPGEPAPASSPASSDAKETTS